MPLFRLKRCGRNGWRKWRHPFGSLEKGALSSQALQLLPRRQAPPAPTRKQEPWVFSWSEILTSTCCSSQSTFTVLPELGCVVLWIGIVHWQNSYIVTFAGWGEELLYWIPVLLPYTRVMSGKLRSSFLFWEKYNDDDSHLRGLLWVPNGITQVGYLQGRLGLHSVNIRYTFYATQSQSPWKEIIPCGHRWKPIPSIFLM